MYNCTINRTRGFNSPEMADEARDRKRAKELYDAVYQERSAAPTRLRAAVRAGDIDAMRAACQGENGFLIGTQSLHGYSEEIVIGEILVNSDLPLELLGVFFKELGGRFTVDLQYNVCVFSMLVSFDYKIRINTVKQLERWTLRMAEVVRYLVEKLEMPIRMTYAYCSHPLGSASTLMKLAVDSGYPSCYSAFLPFIRPATGLSPADEARDTERARELYDGAFQERDAALTRLRAAVRAGDVDAMRAAYQGRGAFLIGTQSLHGYSEETVMTEVLKNSDLPLELLGVLFNELGGRFMVDIQYNVCVFSMLVSIEGRARFSQVEETERWTLRMAEVVRFLVEKLEMPIRMPKEYCAYPLTTPSTLMQLALDSDGWACYTAFSQFIRPARAFSLLEHIVQSRYAEAKSNYFVKRLAAEDGASLWKLSQRTNIHPEHLAILETEGMRFAQTLEHMQALLLLQSKGPGNAAARAVMDNHTLSHMILTLGFEWARFYTGTCDSE